MEFIFGTQNEHKVNEVMSMLSISDLRIISLRQLNFSEEIVEDGSSFEENAWIKANYIHDRFGGNVIAEDSGLEVDCLEGAPGIYSSRYAGKEATSEANMQKLLFRMEGIEDRRARFRSVVTVWYLDHPYIFEGAVEGRIAIDKLGSGGFGYDPVFIPAGYDKSFGQLPAKIKNEISHRSKAFEKFRSFLVSI